jgi:hypothetical protein
MGILKRKDELVRGPAARTLRDRPAYGCGLCRTTGQPDREADRKTASGGHPPAVRLSHQWRNPGDQSGGLGAWAEVRRYARKTPALAAAEARQCST